VALGIETDLIAPVPRASFEARRDQLARYLGTRLLVANQGAACAPGSPDIDYSGLPDQLVIAAPYRCSGTIARLSITYLLFFDIDVKHRSLGRLVLPRGAEEFLFDRAVTTLEVAVDQPQPQLAWFERFRRILWLGVEHILSGYDHLLFLFALLIVAASFWNTVTVVTAFTVSHSLTLALAWFGFITLPARLVEGLIALSIAYVAVENILGRGTRRRWLVAGGFGLVPGLGFSTVLREISSGVGDTVTTLLAFNLGVEAGQLCVVALAYGPIVWWARQAWYRSSARAGSAMILLVASWWMIERLILR
jgi:hydrogenase/urease accessory protein HupE